mmetsp:Transcript_4254/g.4868  ORF Transcript_4254/g.4868 Transcript_4254/m.4868 type:complete len:115 (+) Transcript_4254:596-940(+)
MDANGNICPNPNNHPVLPASIHIHDEPDENSMNWDNNIHDFDTLTASNVDCNDAFWNEACTSDYCSTQRHATERAAKVMSIPYILSTNTLHSLCDLTLNVLDGRHGGELNGLHS